MSRYKPPAYDCPLCPRLLDFRTANRKAYPEFYNGPVPSFGALEAELLIVGLAPGLKGANQTGRPFTGDYAGIILYAALEKHGFAEGKYDPEKVTSKKNKTQVTSQRSQATDGFVLLNCRVTNAVRCVPPANKPEPSEIKQCNAFLVAEIKAMKRLKVIVSLGQIAHKAVVQVCGLKQSQYTFGHAVRHDLQLATGNLQLLNSYHTSRYNINTGTLTQNMFDDVIRMAQKLIAGNT